MVHHADFAVAIPHRLEVETRHDRPGADGRVAVRVIALGWWVDPPGAQPAGGGEPVGTLYLVVDEALARPVWVAQGELTAVRLLD